jgi:hypothetical protein
MTGAEVHGDLPRPGDQARAPYSQDPVSLHRCNPVTTAIKRLDSPFWFRLSLEIRRKLILSQEMLLGETSANARLRS